MLDIAKKVQAVCTNHRTSKQEWTRDLARARQIALTKKNIVAGWAKTGLYPFDRSKVAPYPDTPANNPTATPTAPSPTPLQCRHVAMSTPLHFITMEAQQFIRNHPLITRKTKTFIKRLAHGWETAAASYAVLESAMAGQTEHIRRIEESAKGKRTRRALKPAAGVFHITRMKRRDRQRQQRKARVGSLKVRQLVLEPVATAASDSEEDEEGFGGGDVEILDLEDLYGSETESDTDTEIEPTLLFLPAAVNLAF